MIVQKRTFRNVFKHCVKKLMDYKFVMWRGVHLNPNYALLDGAEPLDDKASALERCRVLGKLADHAFLVRGVAVNNDSDWWMLVNEEEVLGHLHQFRVSKWVNYRGMFFVPTHPDLVERYGTFVIF